jgi:hypothetical protein
MVNNEILNSAIARVVDAANSHRGREPSQAFRDALNALVALDGPDAEQMRSHLAAALPALTSPSGAGFLALWLGAGVEGGADPFPQTQPLLDCMLRFTRQVRTDNEAVNEVEGDDELAIGLEFLGQGIVAHLSRDPTSLRALQSDEEVVAELERVEACTAGSMWILELVRRVSGNIIVMHGEQPAGARVEYRNLSNCFHLFTFLQAALTGRMPGARKVAAGVLEVARGEHQATCWDEAWWHYGQPVDGPPNLSTSVFGEQSPQDIGSIYGQQIMLLWPPILASRAWDAGFFGPALHAAPAEVQVIEILSEAEVTMWRQRIGLPDAIRSKAKRSWWMFW